MAEIPLTFRVRQSGSVWVVATKTEAPDACKIFFLGDISAMKQGEDRAPVHFHSERVFQKAPNV